MNTVTRVYQLKPDDLARLNRLLNKIKVELNLNSWNKVGEVLNIDPNALSRYRNGSLVPSSTSLINIAEVTGLSVRVLKAHLGLSYSKQLLDLQEFLLNDYT